MCNKQQFTLLIKNLNHTIGLKFTSAMLQTLWLSYISDNVSNAQLTFNIVNMFDHYVSTFLVKHAIDTCRDIL